MDKQKAVELLKANGYTVDDTSDFPRVLTDKDVPKVSKAVGKLLKDAGYNNTYGVRFYKGENDAERIDTMGN